MKRIWGTCCLLLLWASLASPAQVWVSLPKQQHMWQMHPALSFHSGQKAGIQLQPEHHYQPIDGFGFTLTGGSADLLYALPATQRANLLAELFGDKLSLIHI
jgi:glucosylceramidase